MIKQNRVIELDDAQIGPATTEEFLAQIHRATQLMQEQRSDEAQQILDAAFLSRQHDPSSQATLGLVYFKLGIYPRAVNIYERLKKMFPEEPTLRLNLGLVYLKTGQTDLAVPELETAVRIEPAYRKAHGYLGLAYQRQGDYYGAKRAFERAGAVHLAERMASISSSISSADEPAPEKTSSTDGGTACETPSDVDETESSALSLAVEGFADGLSSVSPDVSNPSEQKTLSQFSQTHRLNPQDNAFRVDKNGYLMVDAEDKYLARLEGLQFLTAKQLSYQPAYRIFRGKTSNELFGSKQNPVFEISGSGRLVFHSEGGVFAAFELDVDSVFVNEAYFFAATPSIIYENGRIPMNRGELVQLAGKGAFAIKTPHPIRSTPIVPDEGIVIPSQYLVGWFGHLLPRPASKSPFPDELTPLEMTGEGEVLFCLP